MSAAAVTTTSTPAACSASITGVLVRDGYAGYEHFTQAIHALCGAHLLRDLRSISDADPTGQLWALAMASAQLDAHCTASRGPRDRRRPPRSRRPDPNPLPPPRHAGPRRDRQQEQHSQLATDARPLIRCFRRCEDMILRFATDLTVLFTNDTAERAIRPFRGLQCTSGGAWRPLQGLTDFAIVQSYLDTATKWGRTKLEVLCELFTTGPWLPPALTPAE